ncbi:MAG TPA: hypothetical protein PK999_17780, partial [Nitrospira sp.]|nr:hypothetical protein [Nitrospira sp.]
MVDEEMQFADGEKKKCRIAGGEVAGPIGASHQLEVAHPAVDEQIRTEILNEFHLRFNANGRGAVLQRNGFRADAEGDRGLVWVESWQEISRQWNYQVTALEEMLSALRPEVSFPEVHRGCADEGGDERI